MRSYYDDDEGKLASWEEANKPIETDSAGKKNYGIFNKIANSTGTSREVYAVVKGAQDNEYWKNLSLKYRGKEVVKKNSSEDETNSYVSEDSNDSSEEGVEIDLTTSTTTPKKDDKSEDSEDKDTSQQIQNLLNALEKNSDQIKSLTTILQIPGLDDTNKLIAKAALNSLLSPQKDNINEQPTSPAPQPIQGDSTSSSPKSIAQTTPPEATVTPAAVPETAPEKSAPQATPVSPSDTVSEKAEEDSPVIAEEAEGVSEEENDDSTATEDIDKSQDQGTENKDDTDGSNGSPPEQKTSSTDSDDPHNPFPDVTPSIKDKTIKEMINQKINNVLNKIAHQLERDEDELNDDSDEYDDESKGLEGFFRKKANGAKKFFKRKKNAILNRAALKIEKFVGSREEAEEEQTNLKNEEKERKEKKKQDKKNFKKEMKKLDPYSGMKLVEELISQYVDQDKGLFDPEYLKGIKFCLKVLSKKGPSGEFFSRSLDKLNYLEKTYKPREKPSDLTNLDESQEGDFPHSTKDPSYLLDKFGFIDAVESEFKMLCHNSFTSMNAVKKTSTHAQQKIRDYKCVITFLGSTLRTSDDKTDENSCQYEYTVLNKMHDDVLERKNLYKSYEESKEKLGEKGRYNVALFRIMGMIFAHEGLSLKNKGSEENSKTLKKLERQYKKKFNDIQKNPNFSDLNDSSVKHSILNDFKKLFDMCSSTNMTKKMKEYVNTLDSASNGDKKIQTNIIEILSFSKNDDITEHKSDIIKKMFPPKNEKFDSTYFDEGKKGARYIGFGM